MTVNEKENLLISACLLGVPCRYDGEDNCIPDHELKTLKALFRLIPVCPEQLGGLPTPRLPSEIRSGEMVLNAEGEDVSINFLRGADAALRIAKLNGSRLACMKEHSPSCGRDRVYDGRFRGVLVRGKGLTVKVFEKNGIKVYNEKEIKKLSGEEHV